MTRDMKDLIVDIFVKEDRMRVVAELPIVQEENIAINLVTDTLSISALGKRLSYYRDVELPRPCKTVIGKMYSNGILEIALC